MFKKPATTVELDLAIERAYSALELKEPGSEQYANIVAQLAKLNAMKTENSRKRISNDTLATIAANLFGIGLILWYERTEIVTSRAMNFVQKLR